MKVIKENPEELERFSMMKDNMVFNSNYKSFGSICEICKWIPNKGADIDELKVSAVIVDKGTSLKRFTARAKGRGNQIEKQTCHISVTLSN